jgi:spore maturation protein CgeB
MDKLRIVFLGEPTDHWYYSNQAIKSRLAEVAEVSWYGLSENSRTSEYAPPLFKGYNEKYQQERDVLKICEKEKPDIILITDRIQTLKMNLWKNLEKTKVPKVQLGGDPHFDSEYVIFFVRKNRINAVLLQYWEGIGWRYQQCLPNCLVGYLPWCIDTRLFKDLKLERTIDFLGVGNYQYDTYPLRRWLWWYAKTKYYERSFILENNLYSCLERDDYIQKINQSKIFLFCTSIYRYPVVKFFEAMACKTMPMADNPIDMERLHLVPNWNFVSVDMDCWRYKMDYFVREESDKERQRIIDNGYETVMKYHTSIIRTEQLLSYCKMLIEENIDEEDKMV